MFAVHSGDLNRNYTRAGTAAPALVSSSLLLQNPPPQKSIQKGQADENSTPSSKLK